MKMDMLKRLFEDDQFIDRYIQVFKVETPKMMQSILDSLASQDFENVSIVAHGLKSQLAYLENEEAHALAAKIEAFAESSENNKYETIEASALKLELLLNKLLVEI